MRTYNFDAQMVDDLIYVFANLEYVSSRLTTLRGLLTNIAIGESVTITRQELGAADHTTKDAASPDPIRYVVTDDLLSGLDTASDDPVQPFTKNEHIALLDFWCNIHRISDPNSEQFGRPIVLEYEEPLTDTEALTSLVKTLNWFFANEGKRDVHLSSQLRGKLADHFGINLP